MKLSLQQKITTGMGAAVGVLLMLAVLAGFTWFRWDANTRWAEHSHDVLYTLERLSLRILRLHAELRTYLITGDPALLSEIAAEGEDVTDSLRALRELVADNPSQVEGVVAIERALNAAEGATREMLRRRQPAGFDAGALAASARAVDELRARIAEVETLERGLLTERLERARRSSALTGAVAVGTAGLAVVLLGIAWGIIGRDFRELAQQDRLIRETSARFEDLYHRAPCGYHTLDPSGRILAVNDTELAWLGYGREEIAGKVSFGGLCRPEDRAKEEAVRARLLAEGEVRSVEFDLLRKDGTLLPVAVSATVVREPSGEISSIRATVHDITAHRQADQAIRELNTNLQRQNSQLEAVNRELEAFSYSVSHDLRAPLRHVDGFAGLLGRHVGDKLDAQGRRYLETISNGAKQMGRLIDDLLSFSRMGRVAMAAAPVDLRALVDEVIRSGGYPRIDWAIAPLPVVKGDRAMLRLALSNLIDNAVKYSRRAAVPRIEIGERPGEPDAAEHVFFVRDNGVGFDMKYADKLFGVFQRLHATAEFEGTGIGLANVRRIVSRHGGRTWAEGQVGVGATFFFSIPVRADAPIPSASADPGPASIET